MLGKLIAAQGKRYVLQDEHFGHQDLTGAMHDALKSDARVVALCSQTYLDSENCLKEATTALTGDSFNKRQRLIPLRIEPCVPDGMLANLAYTDLLAERRQADATMHALAILTALGFDKPSLAGIPAPPDGALIKRVQVTPDKFRLKTNHLAPRDALLARVTTAFRAPQPLPGVRRTAISNSPYVMQTVAGMGGVGKTMLALDYARQHAGDYQGVWWIEAETRQQMLQDLASLGARLEPAIGALATSDLATAAKRTVAIIEEGDFAKPWLLVYDNVDKPGDIEDLTPTANAHVLITTRWSNWHGMAGKIDVGLFEPDEAVDYLCDRGGSNDRAAAAALAAALGFLPLAIDHAGSYCRSRRRSFATYLDDVALLIKKAPKDKAGFAQYPASVYATFRLAVDRVLAGDEARNIAGVPEAGPLMAIAAYLAPDQIPRALLDLTGLPAAGVDDATAALAEVSLVTLGETGRSQPSFGGHRLVQLVAQGLVRAEAGERQLLGLALAIVDHSSRAEVGSRSVAATGDRGARTKGYRRAHLVEGGARHLGIADDGATFTGDASWQRRTGAAGGDTRTGGGAISLVRRGLRPAFPVAPPRSVTRRKARRPKGAGLIYLRGIPAGRARRACAASRIGALTAPKPL